MDLQENKTNPYINCTKDLSTGLTDLYKLPLTNSQTQLKELNVKQDLLLSQIHQENLNLAEVQFSPDIQEMFKKMSIYHNKLINIKKDMKQIHERSTKLKKRSVKLQLVKDKEKVLKMNTELEIKRETDLIGPGPNKSDDSGIS